VLCFDALRDEYVLENPRTNRTTPIMAAIVAAMIKAISRRPILLKSHLHLESVLMTHDRLTSLPQCSNSRVNLMMKSCKMSIRWIAVES
jgi:hypothetical protein